jgi:Replication-relaxation
MSGNRLGRRGIEHLRGELSDRDRAVLESVADLRLMSARQIEALHFVAADHRSGLAAARACRRVLERLVVRDGVLLRLERRVGGIRAGSASYVYGLTHIGQRVLDTGGPRRRFREPSGLYVEHTLAISQLVVDLTMAARSGEFEILDLQPEPRCWRQFSGNYAMATLRPDLYVVVGTPDFEYSWFVEVDRGSEHLPTLLAKSRVYDDYYRTGAEQRTHGIFPRVCWTVPKEDRAESLAKKIEGDARLQNAMFEITTSDRALDVLTGASR